MAANSSERERQRAALDDIRTQIDALRQEQVRISQAINANAAIAQEKLRADLEKAELEVRKLRADLEPGPSGYEKGVKELARLDAEKRRLDGEFDPASNNYQKGIKELAKLDAEKRKLDYELDPAANNYQRGIKELAKLEAEKRKIDCELDPAANNYQRGVKELAKLEAEKRKLDFELDPAANNYQRGIKELAKLDAEQRKLSSDRVAEWFKTGGTMLLAGAAILTWWLTSAKNEQERDARYRADAAHLVESLGAPQAPQLRAAAAIGLRSFIADERTRPLVLGSLAYSLGIESQVDVQHAMADSLVAAGQDSVPLLEQMISRVNSEVEIGLDKLGDIPNCGRGNDLDAIIAQQNSMTAAVLAVGRIRAAKPDFSGLNFKCFKLHPLGRQLRDAVLHGTTLWNADLYKMDLTGADLSEVHAFGAKFNKTNLQGTNFSGADLEMAVFSGSSVDNAQFVGADLDGADLSTSSGLTEQQLRSAAHLYCAKLPPALSAGLAQRLIPPSSARCR